MKTIFALVASICMCGAVMAAPINQNVRQVTIGTAVGGDSVQDILDDSFANSTDADTDQSVHGYFGVATPASTSILPQFIVKNTATAAIGIYSVDGAFDTTSSLTEYEIFSSSAGEDWTATVKWTTDTSGKITVFDDQGDIVGSQTSFSGLDKNGFGFYGETTTRYYSMDDLNSGGAAKVLTYQDGSTTNWGFFFETGTNTDYNEAFMFVESITGVVPEPGTYALFGLAALGYGVIRRRRRA